MRKKYFYVVFLFLFTLVAFAQKVTITPTSVNGANINTGPINLAGVPYSTISLGVTVEFPANAAVGDLGTIKIYYAKSTALGSNVTIGGDGGALYFGGGKVATRSITINLSWGDFLTSGGYIYAEYKNTSGGVSKSSNIAVIKNATMTTGTTLNPPSDAPNPTKIPNTLCCDQIVRIGEKPATITGTTYLNPYQGEPYGINSSWSAIGLGSVRFISNDRSTLNIDYLTEPGKFTVTRGLGYTYGGQYPNKSNAVTITIVPSPMIRNEISINNVVDGNGFAEIMDTNPKDIFGETCSVNLNILQNPFYIPKRGDTTANIEKYEWEYSRKSVPSEGANNWITIPNENATSLNSSKLPNISTSEDNFYLIRRIAVYQNIRSASNTLKIVLRTIRNNNTICCDQTLKVLSQNEIEKPNIIKGSDAISSKNQSLFYQWQSRLNADRINPGGNWTNISGATLIDYQPTPLQFVVTSGIRGGESHIPTYNYRRIAQTNYYNGGEISYSNEISLIPSYEDTSVSSITVYPNPTTSIINIENKEGNFIQSDIILSIVNIMGAEVNSNNFLIVNPNLVTVNISNLIPGTYFLNLKAKRRYYQFTFIKQ